MRLVNPLMMLAALASSTNCLPTEAQIMIAYQSPNVAAEKIGHTIFVQKTQPSTRPDNVKVFFLTPGSIKPVVIRGQTIEVQKRGLRIAKQSADALIKACQKTSNFTLSSISTNRHSISFLEEIYPIQSSWVFFNINDYCDIKTGKVKNRLHSRDAVITGIYKTRSRFEAIGGHELAIQSLRTCTDARASNSGLSASAIDSRTLQISSQGWNYVTLRSLKEICAIAVSNGNCPMNQVKLADGTCMSLDFYQHKYCATNEEIHPLDLICTKLFCNKNQYIENHQCQTCQSGHRADPSNTYCMPFANYEEAYCKAGEHFDVTALDCKQLSCDPQQNQFLSVHQCKLCPLGTKANAQATACMLSLGTEQRVWSSEIKPPPNILCRNETQQLSLQLEFPKGTDNVINGRLFCGGAGNLEYTIEMNIDSAGNMVGTAYSPDASQGTLSTSYPIALVFNVPPYRATIAVSTEPPQTLPLNLRQGPLPPRILEFASDRSEIVLGSTATLAWRVYNAQSVSILPSGVSRRNESEGAIVVQPVNTTTYRLIASNDSSSRSEKSVTVAVVPQNCPRRITFEAAPQDLAANPSLVQKPEFSPYVGGDAGFTYGIHRALKNLDNTPERLNSAKYNIRFFDSGAALNTDCKYRLSATFAAAESRPVDITIDSESAQRLLTAVHVLGQTTKCWGNCAEKFPIGRVTLPAGSKQFSMRVERNWAFPHIYLFDLDLEK